MSLIPSTLIIWNKEIQGIQSLTLCLPSLTIGTAARSPTSTFGTENVAMQNELNPIVFHLWTQWHCLELSVDIH